MMFPDDLCRLSLKESMKSFFGTQLHNVHMCTIGISAIPTSACQELPVVTHTVFRFTCHRNESAIRQDAAKNKSRSLEN